MSRGSAIIVGVGPGLGLALADAFAKDGHPVALLGRDPVRLKKYASTLAAEGGTAGAYQADATDPESLRTALVQASDDLGAPEALVYNAALLTPDTPTSPDAAEFAYALSVNVTGAMVSRSAQSSRCSPTDGARCCSPAAASLSTRRPSTRRCRSGRRPCGHTSTPCTSSSRTPTSM